MNDDATFTYDAELGSGYFIRVPSAFMRLPKEQYSAEAKVAYCVLLSYAASNETAWPGLSRLCDEVGCSENTLRAALKELLSGGLVSINRRGQGKSNIYTLHKFDASFRTSKTEVQEPQNMRIKNLENSGTKTSETEAELRKEINDSKREREEAPQAAQSSVSEIFEASDSKPKARRKTGAPSLSDKQMTLFCEWYSRYPHKVGKQEAIKAWHSINPDAESMPLIFDGMARWEKSQRWSDGIYQNPATWLNAKAWEDYPVPAKPAPAKSSFAPGPPPKKATMYREFNPDAE